ncbi:unnamed protein product [Rangifer tarandus platyrhynchus]|uniref:Uncharacterized protein n=1 Tax=Rangifer tarandus platyrhynchus TaxID=3082113 RepID=A0ABN8Y3G4_RANTA|nr:unnamed protein product [Rangifer tarandus platyrhynchus]
MILCPNHHVTLKSGPTLGPLCVSEGVQDTKLCRGTQRRGAAGGLAAQDSKSRQCGSKPPPRPWSLDGFSSEARDDNSSEENPRPRCPEKIPLILRKMLGQDFPRPPISEDGLSVPRREGSSTVLSSGDPARVQADVLDSSQDASRMLTQMEEAFTAE